MPFEILSDPASTFGQNQKVGIFSSFIDLMFGLFD